MDFGQGLGEFRASRRQLRLPPVVLRARHIGPGDELSRPIEFNLRQRQCGLALVDSGDPRVQESDLVVDILHGVLQVPAPAPCLRFDRAHRRGGCLQVCFRGVDRCLLLGDRNPVRLLVQLGEEISLVHTVVVVHQNAGNLSCHAGRNKRHVPIHECVVRGDGVEHLLDPRDAEHEENCQDSNAEHTGQKLSLPRSLSGLLRHGADSGGVCADFASWAAEASPFAVGCALIEPGLLLCSVMSGTRCKETKRTASKGHHSS